MTAAMTVGAIELPETPPPAHYTGAYLTCGRIHSFAHQLDAVLGLEPQRVLEIGVGPGVVTAALRQLGIDVITLDVNSELQPDVCASVTDIPLDDDSVDVTVCCQVLEHLPFEQAALALRELVRVTGNAMVMSLPDITRCVEFTVALPKLGRRRCTFSPPRLRPPTIDPRRVEQMGHYWEIGYRGTTLPTVRRAIEQCGWTIVRTWRVPELTWHRFFQLEPDT